MRIWVERRTGVVKAVSGPPIGFVDGELSRSGDLPRLREALREPRLRWRDQAVGGVGKPVIGPLLLDEARAIPSETPGPSVALTFRQTSRLDLSAVTNDWIFAGGKIADLIRLNAVERRTVHAELGALMVLGLCSTQTSSPQERRERDWLKGEYARVRRAETERDLIGVGPRETSAQVLFIAKKKVQRCLELRDNSSNRRVQQMATQVAGAVMSAAKAVCEA